MSGLPKLKVKWWGRWEGIIDFDQSKSFLPFGRPYPVSIVVEGQSISSYDELVQLANQDRYKDKEFLEVAVIMLVGGG